MPKVKEYENQSTWGLFDKILTKAVIAITQSEYDEKKANGEDMSKYCVVQYAGDTISVSR